MWQQIWHPPPARRLQCEAGGPPFLEDAAAARWHAAAGARAGGVGGARTPADVCVSLGDTPDIARAAPVGWRADFFEAVPHIMVYFFQAYVN